MDLLYRRSLILTCWSGAVLIFATQWFLYDEALGHADPFRYYLGWSGYIWGILTPAVVMFAYRNPVTTATWKRSLPLHLGVCLMLVVGAISMEAMLGKLRTHQTLS